MKNNKTEKVLIFDSSSIINFVLNGLLEEFRGLKKAFGGKFLITEEVKKEIVEKPSKIKRFELEALKIKALLDEKILEMPLDIGVKDQEVSEITNDIHYTANNTFFGRGNAIHIIDSGEESCLALSKLLGKKGIKNLVVIDERTIRMLCERPENLASLLHKRMHTKIEAKTDNFKLFEGFKFIRSTELIYIAYKKGIVKLKNHDVLDALLYAFKFNGCSISDEEINEIKKMGNKR